jgi:hypothetical protein
LLFLNNVGTKERHANMKFVSTRWIFSDLGMHETNKRI